jgi:hypothetical protein
LARAILGGREEQIVETGPIACVERCDDVIQHFLGCVELLLYTSESKLPAPVALGDKDAVAAVCHTVVARLVSTTLPASIFIPRFIQGEKMVLKSVSLAITLILRLRHAKQAFDRFVLRGTGTDARRGKPGVNGVGTSGGPGPECFDMVRKGYPGVEISQVNNKTKGRLRQIWRRGKMKEDCARTPRMETE